MKKILTAKNQVYSNLHFNILTNKKIVNMKKQLVFFFLLPLFLIGQSLYGQQPIEVGIPSHTMNYFASLQNNSNWCWAASIQMILNYYRINIDQEDIVRRSYGTDPYGNLPNWQGSPQIITANLNNWNIDKSGKKYTVQSVLYNGAPLPSYLINELLNGRPVLVGYKSSSSGGHAVVITAVSYINTFNGPVIQTITVRDPWPSSENVANKGKVVYAGLNFANMIMQHWYVRVF